MPGLSQTRFVLLAFMVALLAMAAPAAASPEAVAADYYADGVINDRHSTSDLLAALDAALEREEPQYGAFADAVGSALDERLLGVQGDDPAQFLGADELAAPPLSPFPSPQPPSAGSGPPLALVALSGLAGLLLVAGAASAVVRRVRTHRAP